MFPVVVTANTNYYLITFTMREKEKEGRDFEKDKLIYRTQLISISINNLNIVLI